MDIVAPDYRSPMRDDAVTSGETHGDLPGHLGAYLRGQIM
jgi:hypothetical protein